MLKLLIYLSRRESENNYGYGNTRFISFIRLPRDVLFNNRAVVVPIYFALAGEGAFGFFAGEGFHYALAQ